MENIIEKNNLKILGQLTPEFDEILTNDALLFVEKLVISTFPSDIPDN